MRTLSLAVLSLLLGACGGATDPKPDGPCPTGGTALTYDNYGKGFMEKHCTECHSVTKTGAARAKAPVGVDFDTHEMIKAQIKDIEHELPSMPPAPLPKPSAEEDAKIREWLSCGAP